MQLYTNANPNISSTIDTSRPNPRYGTGSATRIYTSDVLTMQHAGNQMCGANYADSIAPPQDRAYITISNDMYNYGTYYTNITNPDNVIRNSVVTNYLPQFDQYYDKKNKVCDTCPDKNAKHYVRPDENACLGSTLRDEFGNTIPVTGAMASGNVRANAPTYLP
jgi:hypothetical protein